MATVVLNPNCLRKGFKSKILKYAAYALKKVFDKTVFLYCLFFGHPNSAESNNIYIILN